jgi:hypothetical protein
MFIYAARRGWRRRHLQEASRRTEVRQIFEDCLEAPSATGNAKKR